MAAIRAAPAPRIPTAMLTTAVISARPVVRCDAAADQELHRAEGDPRPDEAGDDADRDALGGRQRQQVAPPRAAGAQQGEVAPVALAGAERREVGDPERHERSRDGEQDVERLGIEGVPGRRVERVREVVDELHLAGQRALHPQARLIGELQRRGRAAGAERRRIELRLDLPLHPLLGARLGVGGCARGRDRGQHPAQRPLEGGGFHDHRVAGRLGRGRAHARVERLEHLVGGRDQRDPGDLVALRRARRAGHERDRVADPRLKRGRRLLVEEDAAGPKRSVQQAEGVDVTVVARRDGEHRPLARLAVARPGPSGTSSRTEPWPSPMPAAIPGWRATALATRRSCLYEATGPLPVERHLANGAGRRRAQRLPDEQQHAGEQRDRGGDHDDSQHRAARAADEPGEREPRVEKDRGHGVIPLLASARERDGAIGARGDVRVVRRDHQCEAELVAKRLDHVEHAVPGVRVEVAGGLVAEQQLRALRQRPGNGDPLRLAA